MTISDVQQKDNIYTVYDEGVNEVRTFFESDVGELVGFGQDFIVFERDNGYKFINGESGDEFTFQWINDVGKFKHANVNLATFEKDGQVITYEVGCSGIELVNSRWE